MKKTNFSAPRGTTDILPDQMAAWQNLEKKAREIFRVYNYKEIRTPIFEETELFARSMGQSSDIVEKQMLSLQRNTREGEAGESRKNYALRPEGTASIVRSYIENNLDKKENLSKLFYLGPMFRGERPQKGRLRQFHQIGAEAIGYQQENDFGIALVDAELICLSLSLLRAFGVHDYELKINSLGTSKDKKRFSSLLCSQLTAKEKLLCVTCQKRFKKNIFRILDCKNIDCQKIVKDLNVNNTYLCSESQQYFDLVTEILDKVGVRYKKIPTLVRGLDYYTQVVFEITSKSLGSQDALGAGGRYNNLISELGGGNSCTENAKIGAAGFALGLERIFLSLGKDKGISEIPSLDVFIAWMGLEAYKASFVLLSQMRSVNISCDLKHQSSSLKSQLSIASRLNAKKVIIIGDEEMRKGAVQLRDMNTRDQREIDLQQIMSILKDRLC